MPVEAAVGVAVEGLGVGVCCGRVMLGVVGVVVVMEAGESVMALVVSCGRVVTMRLVLVMMPQRHAGGSNVRGRADKACVGPSGLQPCKSLRQCRLGCSQPSESLLLLPLGCKH